MLNINRFFRIDAEKASETFKACSEFLVEQSKPWAKKVGETSEAKLYEETVLKQAEQDLQMNLEKGFRMELAAECSLLDLIHNLGGRPSKAFSKNWMPLKDQALRLIPFWDRMKKLAR